MARVAFFAFLLAAVFSPALAQDSRPRPEPDPKAVVDDLRRLVSAKRFADAWKSRVAVRAAVDAPACPADLRAEAASLVLAAGLETVGGAAGFQGHVELGEKGILEVRYDFAAAPFEGDFELLMALPAAAQPERDKRIVRGTGALCHRASWATELRIDLAGRPLIAQDFGPVFLDPDETATERFLTGFHNNAYFGIKYEAERAVTAGHVLLLAGRGAVSRARTRPTQLLGRTGIPIIASRTEVRASLWIQGSTVHFVTGTSPTATGRLTFDLAPATQTFQRTRPGVLFRNSELEIASITLRGRLDPAWERDEVARLRATLAR
jgi:hypothetical protein